MLAKKSLETGEDIDSIPESMRAYLAMQAMESGKALGPGYLGRTGLLPFGHNGMLMPGDQNAQGKVLIHHLTCRSLGIGKWTRVGQNTMDLIIFYSPDKCTMTYYINNEQAGYKIEYPFSHIKNIFLDNNEADPNNTGGIVIELNRPPNFFMDSSPTSNGFWQCGDFTEDLQASNCLVHHLGGNPKVLSGQLAKLVSLESFMNRHNQQQMPFADPHAISMSAPVSPIARPSSQPAFPQQNMMFEEPWGMSNMHSATMRPPMGHKRQRSRSVPGPVDFSMFQNQPMPSFYIQPPGDMGPPQHNPQIYAPVPQQPGNINTHLRIDTQAGFGLDMRQFPASAASAASGSEFPQSPGFFAEQHETPQTGMPPSSFNTPFSNPGGFLSPMPTADQTTSNSVSPVPFANPNEQSMVGQSPPGLMLGHAGADLYNGNESAAVSDDGTMNEMYSRQSVSLPLHQDSPGFNHAGHNGSMPGELDMESLVHFDGVDHSSLSPEVLNQNH